MILYVNYFLSYCMILYVYVHVLNEDKMKIFMMKIFIDSGVGDDLCQLNINGLHHCPPVPPEVFKETVPKEEADEEDNEEAGKRKGIDFDEHVEHVEHVEDVQNPASNEEQQGVGLEELPHVLLLAQQQDELLDEKERPIYHTHGDDCVLQQCEHDGGKSEEHN